MSTVGRLVSRSRRMLRGSKRNLFNVLDASVPSGQAYFDLVHDVSPIAKGDYLGVGSEVAYVTAVDTSSGRVDVIRAVDDTVEPTSHPAGTRVEINWRFLTADLLGYLVDEIRSWPDTIYVQAATSPLSIPVSSRAVDLPLTRFRYPLDAIVRRQGATEWIDLPGHSHRIRTGVPTSEFSSGNTLTVVRGWGGSSVIVRYAQGFDLSAVEDVTTDTDDIGLSEHLYDAAVYGVAWRALAAEEANRSDDTSQPEPRNADEVDPFDAMRAASAYKAIRDQRLDEERRRLGHLNRPRFG